jgi:hypothetical protein
MEQTQDTATLWQGEGLRLVFTAGVNAATQRNERIVDEGQQFKRAVYEALLRFARGDWGDTDSEDAQQMDAIRAALDSADRSEPRLLMGEYIAAGQRIWITRQVTDADGGQSLTVLFPSEY